MLSALVGLQTSAFAQTTTAKGLQTATDTMEEVKDAFVLMVGVFVLIYLIYMGVMAMTERKSWAQFGWAVVYVALVGGAVNMATWAYNLFK